MMQDIGAEEAGSQSAMGDSCDGAADCLLYTIRFSVDTFVFDRGLRSFSRRVGRHLRHILPASPVPELAEVMPANMYSPLHDKELPRSGDHVSCS